MSDFDTIREFLVALGFRVKEDEYNKFNGKIAEATKSAAKLGAVAVGAATAMEAFVAKVSDGLEKLYFVSQRTKSSVENIQAFSFAASQMGSTVEAAQGSLEGLASFMRSNPGSGRFLASLGVSPEALKDTVSTARSLGKIFQTMPFYRAKVYASFLGIDEKTLMALTSGMEDFGEKYKRIYRAAGVDQDRAAEQAHQFMSTLRELGVYLDALADKLTVFFSPIAERFLKFIMRGLELVLQFNPALGEWKGLIAEAAIALGMLFFPLTTVAFLILALIDDFETFMEGGQSLINWSKLWNGVLKTTRDLLKQISDYMKDSWVSRQFQRVYDYFTKPGGAGEFGQAMDAMQFFEKMGWTKAQAAGIVANLQRESNLNPQAVGDNGQAIGVAQWHPDRQQRFKDWAGYDIRQASLADQLAFVNHELTRGSEAAAGRALSMAQSPEEAGNIVSRLYERPANTLGEAALRSGSAAGLYNQSLQQTTHINVTGATDAQATANAIAGEQSQVNGGLVRNFTGAVK